MRQFLDRLKQTTKVWSFLALAAAFVPILWLFPKISADVTNLEILIKLVLTILGAATGWALGMLIAYFNSRTLARRNRNYPEMGNIFIASSSEDRNLATVIAEDLRDEGYFVFDPIREALPGEDIGKLIDEYMAKSHICLIILSKGTERSHTLKRIIRIARDKGIYVVPYYVSQGVQAPRQIQDIKPVRDKNELFDQMPHLVSKATHSELLVH